MDYFNDELVFIPKNEVVVSIKKRTKSLNYNDLKVGKTYLVFTISTWGQSDGKRLTLKEIKDDVLYFENEKKETVVIKSVNLSKKKFEDIKGYKIDILEYFYKDYKVYQQDFLPNLRFSNFSFSDKGKIEIL
jgi:hypothetical protein